MFKKPHEKTSSTTRGVGYDVMIFASHLRTLLFLIIPGDVRAAPTKRPKPSFCRHSPSRAIIAAALAMEHTGPACQCAVTSPTFAGTRVYVDWFVCVPLLSTLIKENLIPNLNRSKQDNRRVGPRTGAVTVTVWQHPQPCCMLPKAADITG
jgi:hypothetical protein